VKYFIQIRYTTINGIAIRYATVDASSQTEAQLIVTQQIRKNEIIEATVIETKKNISRKR